MSQGFQLFKKLFASQLLAEELHLQGQSLPCFAGLEARHQHGFVHRGAKRVLAQVHVICMGLQARGASLE